jgi:hypothetical protein
MTDDTDELESLVRELIDEGIDHVALAKTLVVVDQFLLLPPLTMSEPKLETMLDKLFWYWVECSDLTDDFNKLEALRAMSPAEMAALKWFDECNDCGERSWVQLHEDYIVHDEIWHQACTTEPVMKNDCGLLCVGCIERRLGRRLHSADFEGGVPCNDVGLDGGKTSLRLLARMQDRENG